MKVVLIRPPQSPETRETNITGIYPPLGLASLAASLLAAGHDAEIIDGEALGITCEKTVGMIPEDAEITGISATTLGWHDAVRLARVIKARRPDLLLMAGGPHPTAFPEAVLRHSPLDIVLTGEAEETITALADILQSTRGEPRPRRLSRIATLSGTAVRHPDGTITSPLRHPSPPNLDSLPAPALHRLPISRYRSLVTPTPFTTIVTSRGCPYRCAYCSQFLTGGRYRIRTPGLVAEEIERHIRDFGTREVIFFDETFGANRKNALETCELLTRLPPPGIRWNARTRSDLVDKELLRAMKAAGCRLIHLGIESASPEILRRMRKGSDPQKNAEAVALAKAAGLSVHGYFMLGYPGETEAEVDETIKFSRAIGLDWASFTITVAQPKTDLFDEAVEAGLVRSDYWEDYTAGKYRNLPLFPPSWGDGTVASLEKKLRSAYRGFYMAPSRLIPAVKTVLSAGGAARLLSAIGTWRRETA